MRVAATPSGGCGQGRWGSAGADVDEPSPDVGAREVGHGSTVGNAPEGSLARADQSRGADGRTLKLVDGTDHAGIETPHHVLHQERRGFRQADQRLLQRAGCAGGISG